MSTFRINRRVTRAVPIPINFRGSEIGAVRVAMIKKKIMTRAISALTLGFFLFSQVAVAGPAAGIEIAVNREAPGFLRIDIPSELASLDGIWEAPPSADSKVVLHIQNAHANYGAQKKIKELLAYLNKTYAIKTIFVEGAAEDLNPDYLKFFPDKARNLELADLLAQQGELTGAELYLLEQDGTADGVKKTPAVEKDKTGGGAKGYGIEDTKLYRNNYEALKKVFGAEVLVNRYLNGFEARQEALSSKIFNKDLRRVLADWKKFEKGNREFMPYVQSLAADAKRFLDVDLESLFAQVEWPQITRLLALQMREKEINVAKALEEKDKLILFLKAKGVSASTIAEVENFREQRLSVRQAQGDSLQPRDALEALAREAVPKGFYFRDYPAFSLYAGYLILKSELDAKGLFEEIKTLFDRILDSLAATPDQKALLELYRDEELARKLLHLELSRRDWQRALARREQVGMDSLVARLKEISAAVTREMKLAPSDLEVKQLSPQFRDDVTRLYDAAFTFYDFARQRENVFYEKMDAVMSRGDASKKAVLITGGFHTDGMTDLFREHNISYGVLTPRLMEKSNEKLYRDTMLQNEQQLFSLSYLELASRLTSYTTQIAQGRKPTESLAKILAAYRRKLPKDLATGRGVADSFNASEASRSNEIALGYLGTVNGKDSYKILGQQTAPEGLEAGIKARSEVRAAEKVSALFGKMVDPLGEKEIGIRKLLERLASLSMEELRKYKIYEGDFDLISRLNFSLGGKGIIGTLGLLKSEEQIIEPTKSPFLEARKMLVEIFKKYDAEIYAGEGFDEFMLLCGPEWREENLEKAIQEFTQAFIGRYEVLRSEKAIDTTHSGFLGNKIDRPYVLRASNDMTGGYILIDRKGIGEGKTRAERLREITKQLGQKFTSIQFESPSRGFFSVSVGAVTFGDVLDLLIGVVDKADGEGKGREYWMERGEKGKMGPDRLNEALVWVRRIADDVLYSVKENGRNAAKIVVDKDELAKFQRTGITRETIERERGVLSSKTPGEGDEDISGCYRQAYGEELITKAGTDLVEIITVQMEYREGVTSRTFNDFQAVKSVGHHGGNEAISRLGRQVRMMLEPGGEALSAKELFDRGYIVYRKAPDEFVIGVFKKAKPMDRGPPAEMAAADKFAQSMKDFLAYDEATKTGYRLEGKEAEKPFNPYLIQTRVSSESFRQLQKLKAEFPKEHLAYRSLSNILETGDAIQLVVWFVEAMKTIQAMRSSAGPEQKKDIVAKLDGELNDALEVNRAERSMIASLVADRKKLGKFLDLYGEAAQYRRREALRDKDLKASESEIVTDQYARQAAVDDLFNGRENIWGIFTDLYGKYFSTPTLGEAFLEFGKRLEALQTSSPSEYAQANRQVMEQIKALQNLRGVDEKDQNFDKLTGKIEEVSSLFLEGASSQGPAATTTIKLQGGVPLRGEDWKATPETTPGPAAANIPVEPTLPEGFTYAVNSNTGSEVLIPIAELSERFNSQKAWVEDGKPHYIPKEPSSGGMNVMAEGYKIATPANIGDIRKSKEIRIVSKEGRVLRGTFGGTRNSPGTFIMNIADIDGLSRQEAVNLNKIIQEGAQVLYLPSPDARSEVRSPGEAAQAGPAVDQRTATDISSTLGSLKTYITYMSPEKAHFRKLFNNLETQSDNFKKTPSSQAYIQIRSAVEPIKKAFIEDEDSGGTAILVRLETALEDLGKQMGVKGAGNVVPTVLRTGVANPKVAVPGLPEAVPKLGEGVLGSPDAISQAFKEIQVNMEELRSGVTRELKLVDWQKLIENEKIREKTIKMLKSKAEALKSEEAKALRANKEKEALEFKKKRENAERALGGFQSFEEQLARGEKAEGTLQIPKEELVAVTKNLLIEQIGMWVGSLGKPLKALQERISKRTSALDETQLRNALAGMQNSFSNSQTALNDVGILGRLKGPLSEIEHKINLEATGLWVSAVKKSEEPVKAALPGLILPAEVQAPAKVIQEPSIALSATEQTPVAQAELKQPPGVTPPVTGQTPEASTGEVLSAVAGQKAIPAATATTGAPLESAPLPTGIELSQKGTEFVGSRLEEGIKESANIVAQAKTLPEPAMDFKKIELGTFLSAGAIVLGGPTAQERKQYQVRGITGNLREKNIGYFLQPLEEDGRPVTGADLIPVRLQKMADDKWEFKLPTKARSEVRVAIEETAKRLTEVVGNMDPETVDVLLRTHFSDVKIADADKDMDVALKVAFLVHGILELNNSDPVEAARQMTVLANVLGAGAMQTILKALPKEHTLPVSDASVKSTVVFYVTQENYEQHLAVAKIMAVLNAGLTYIFVGDNEVTVQKVTTESRKWVKEMSGRSIPDLANRLQSSTEKLFNKTMAPALQARTGVILAVADGFKATDFSVLAMRAPVVKLEYTGSERTNPAAHTGLVKFSREVAKTGKKMSELTEGLLAGILEKLPEFDQDAFKKGKIAITDNSLKSVVEKIWQEFQSIVQTAVAA